MLSATLRAVTTISVSWGPALSSARSAASASASTSAASSWALTNGEPRAKQAEGGSGQHRSDRGLGQHRSLHAWFHVCSSPGAGLLGTGPRTIDIIPQSSANSAAGANASSARFIEVLSPPAILVDSNWRRFLRGRDRSIGRTKARLPDLRKFAFSLNPERGVSCGAKCGWRHAMCQAQARQKKSPGCRLHPGHLLVEEVESGGSAAPACTTHNQTCDARAEQPNGGWCGYCLTTILA